MKNIFLLCLTLLLLALPFTSAYSYWEMQNIPTQNYDHHSVGYLGSHYSSINIDGVTSYSYEKSLNKNCNNKLQSKALPYYWRQAYPYYYSDLGAQKQVQKCSFVKKMPSFNPEQKCTSCACNK